MIVLLLIFSIPCRSDAGRFSFSIYVHYCTPFHENFKRNFQFSENLFLKKVSPRMDRRFLYLIVAEKLLDPK